MLPSPAPSSFLFVWARTPPVQVRLVLPHMEGSLRFGPLWPSPRAQHTHTHARARAHAHKHSPLHIHIHTYIHTHACMRAQEATLQTFERLHRYVRVCACVCVHVRVHMCVCARVCSLRSQVLHRDLIHTHTRTHTHTCARAHAHAHRIWSGAVS